MLACLFPYPIYEICFYCIPATCNEICEFILGTKLSSDPCYFSLAVTHALLIGCIGTHGHDTSSQVKTFYGLYVNFARDPKY